MREKRATRTCVEGVRVGKTSLPGSAHEGCMEQTQASTGHSSWGAGTVRASPPIQAGSGRRKPYCICARQW